MHAWQGLRHASRVGHGLWLVGSSLLAGTSCQCCTIVRIAVVSQVEQHSPKSHAIYSLTICSIYCLTAIRIYSSIDIPFEAPSDVTSPLNGTQVETPLSRIAGLHFAGSALNLANTALAILSSKTPMRTNPAMVMYFQGQSYHDDVASRAAGRPQNGLCQIRTEGLENPGDCRHRRTAASASAHLDCLPYQTSISNLQLPCVILLPDSPSLLIWQA